MVHGSKHELHLEPASWNDLGIADPHLLSACRMKVQHLIQEFLDSAGAYANAPLCSYYSEIFFLCDRLLAVVRLANKIGPMWIPECASPGMVTPII
jgi:hypothetical protein